MPSLDDEDERKELAETDDEWFKTLDPHVRYRLAHLRREEIDAIIHMARAWQTIGVVGAVVRWSLIVTLLSIVAINQLWHQLGVFLHNLQGKP